MIDIVILIVMLLAFLIGILRGAIKEIFLLISFAFSILFTVNFYDLPLRLLDIKSNLAFNIASAVCLYAVSIIVLMLLVSFLMLLIKPIRLGPVDRIFGAIIGLLKGSVISYLILIIIQLFYYTVAPISNKDFNQSEQKEFLPSWFQESLSYKIYEVCDSFVNTVLPEQFYVEIETVGNTIVKALEGGSSPSNEQPEAAAKDKNSI